MKVLMELLCLMNKCVSVVSAAHKAWQLASEVHLCYDHYNIHGSELIAGSVTTLSTALALPA
jgi:hypothetical protein